MTGKRRKKPSVSSTLSPSQKIRYIWDYYKLPIAIILIFLYIAVWQFLRMQTKEEIFLYGALINVSVNEDLEKTLRIVPTAFGEEEDQDEGGIIQLATGWYLTDHPTGDTYTYTQATQMKILGSIDAEQLDFVIMDREAFDAFAQNGFLLDLSAVDFGSSQTVLSGCLTENMEIVEDNAKEVALDPSIPYHSETRTYPMAIDLSTCPPIREAGFPEPVYLGIISNSPRRPRAVSYVCSLWDA